MSNFDLKNENVEDWDKAEFWESDPMQNNTKLCRICLYVDWESEDVCVETVISNTGTPINIWNGLASRYDLPDDADFTQFVEYYNDKIKPIIQKIGSGFESYWNGSNWKGSFSEETAELDYKLEQVIEKIPTHDMMIYFNLLDSYGGYKHDLLDDLEKEGIDLLTADLDNEDVMEKAVKTVTWNEGSDYKLINVDVEDELREIQKEIQDEAEEDE